MMLRTHIGRIGLARPMSVPKLYQARTSSASRNQGLIRLILRITLSDTPPDPFESLGSVRDGPDPFVVSVRRRFPGNRERLAGVQGRQ
jgi:hypothetical protein